MDIVLASVAGILMKIIDEIYDTKIVINPNHMEYLKTLCTVIFTLSFYKNIGFTLFFIKLTLECIYLNEVDNSYWKSLTPLPFIVLLLQYKRIYYININELFIMFIFFCIFFIINIFEGTIFTKENSFNKIYLRIIFFLWGVIVLYITKSIPYRNCITPIIFLISYLFTSVIFKTILIDYLQFEETPVSKSNDLLQAKESLLNLIEKFDIKA